MGSSENFRNEPDLYKTARVIHDERHVHERNIHAELTQCLGEAYETAVIIPAGFAAARERRGYSARASWHSYYRAARPIPGRRRACDNDACR
jgi:hypothetical protein